MNDRDVTKREVLLSIAIICVMLLLGFLIADAINDSVMEKHQVYNTALQINKDKELFEHGMKTDVGNAFVYGELKAIDTVGYEEINGEYSYVKKVKEKYTKHTRVVVKTRMVNGKSKSYTTTETYWTWDEVDQWDKRSTKISFIGVEFNYGAIDFPTSSHIKTINQGGGIRYVYYGAPAKCTGTLYTELKNNTINGSEFYINKTIEETIKSFESNWELVVFWIGWVVLTIGVVIVFYYIDNRWLEDAAL